MVSATDLMKLTWVSPGSKRVVETSAPERVVAKAPLNEEQQAAVNAMAEFLKGDEPFFLLQGPAGTGKTFCIKSLVTMIKGRLVFTAPTNKATKVLRDSVTDQFYKPDCRTLYSLLGLKLEANGEVKELTEPEDELDLTKFAAIVVDEGSMVNAALFRYCVNIASSQGVKFIVMADGCQLPPVGEARSPVLGIQTGAALTTIMRYDNQILALATYLRGRMEHPAPSFKVTSDNDGGEGVWKLNTLDFHGEIKTRARNAEFSVPNKAKVIAWCNATVDGANRFIRRVIFGLEADLNRWIVGDRCIVTAPAKNLDGDTIATTDDEGEVQAVVVDYHPVETEFKCYRITVCFDTNEIHSLWALHEDSAKMFQGMTERLADEARKSPRMWKRFWSFKEQFHEVRHGYAITAHRAQGSTYETVFVDSLDILQNRNRAEAFKCLYVACTRAKTQLIIA